jgi:riboflavin kinase/FMN adenylyltransferase
MKLYRDYNELPFSRSVDALVIGNFDGLHLGHQALWREAFGKGTMAVLSFDPHPQAILRPDVPVQRLRPAQDLIDQADAWGAQFMLLQRFNRALSEWPALTFCERVVKGAVRPRWVLVGANFRFGRDRQGDAGFLRDFCSKNEMQFQAIESVQVDGAVVSTSRIKDLVRRGDVALARRLLGRPFYILGVVEAGHSRGRDIGFPTANISLGDLVAPRWGVYACRVTGAGLANAPAVANIGVRPTFGEGAEPRLEVHVLDFVGDLYGSPLRVDLCAFLRQETQFRGAEDLRAQIERDLGHARRVLMLEPTS